MREYFFKLVFEVFFWFDFNISFVFNIGDERFFFVKVELYEYSVGCVW